MAAWGYGQSTYDHVVEYNVHVQGLVEYIKKFQLLDNVWVHAHDTSGHFRCLMMIEDTFDLDDLSYLTDTYTDIYMQSSFRK